MSEQELAELIQLRASKDGQTLFRNNSGALKDATGRQVRYGLGNVSKKVNKQFKSSDYIGITPVLITANMVGMTLGVFTAIEVKKPDWEYKGTEREVAQLNYINIVQKNGGIATFAKSVDDYVTAIFNYIFRAGPK